MAESKTETKTEKKPPRHKPKRIFGNLLFMYGYLHKYAPEYLRMTLLLTLGNIISNVLVSTLYIKYLFDAIEAGNDFFEILVVTLIAAVFVLFFYLYRQWMDEVFRPRTNLKLHQGMQMELYEKARKLDQSCYDDPEFYNDFVWSMQESDSRVVRLINDFNLLLNRITGAIAIFSILVYIDWIVALVVLLSTVISFRLQIVGNRKGLKRAEELNVLERKKSYVRRVFYLKDHAKELRQGQVVDRLKDLYRDSTQQVSATYKKHKSLYWITLARLLVNGFLFDVGVTGYLITRYAIDPSLSLGSFSVGIETSWRLNWHLYQIADVIERFNEHSIYIEKFRHFLAYEPKIKDGSLPAPPLEVISLDHVSFSYPGKGDNAKKVLDDVSITVRRGEKVALVGYNGAGKSTLVKLLMRLYDPTKGCVNYNGKSLKDYTIQSLRSHIGAVFQDYKIFAATIGENVIGGIRQEGDSQQITNALGATSFTEKLETLPLGLDTILTREFKEDGVELSGGESQKIAIARVFTENHDLLILDEPSSALDPLAEYELNQSLMDNAKDKTVIFISHRLSTTRFCDRIYMFDSGKLTEAGSHDELMHQNGKYAEMFLIQAKKYQEKF